MVADIVLRLHGGNGAIRSGGDHLAQALDTDVPRGEHAGDVGVHIVIRPDIAVLHLQHSLEELGVGVVADEAEEPEEPVVLVRRDLGQLPGLDVLHRHGAEQVVAVHPDHHAVPHEGDLGVGEGLLLDGLGSPQLVPAVDNGHLAGELGQVHGLLHGAVAAAHHVHLKVLKEGGVAGGAEGDALAGDCIKMIKPMADKYDVCVSLKGTPLFVYGDKSLLEELIYNLCDNAIRYNKKGGHVWVTVTDKLIVQDDGIGIPKKCQKQVFERFFRVDKSRSKKTGGTGLGLAIVKHIAQVHNADISLDSDEGFGTTICVKFSENPPLA